MKKISKRNIIFVIVSIILSISFSAYLIYEQKGNFDKVNIISLLITTIILVFISVFMLKKLQK